MAKKKVETPTVEENVELKEKMVTAFFKENPQAKSVVIVDDQLFLGSHYGAAKEFATRMGKKLEEIQNPNLVTNSESDEVFDAEN